MTLTDSRNQPVPFAQEPAKMHPITPTTQVHQPQCSEESVKHSGQWFTELSAFKPRKRYTESAFRHSAGECRQRKASWVLGPLNKLVWSRLATFKCAPHSTHTHTRLPFAVPGRQRANRRDWLCFSSGARTVSALGWPRISPRRCLGNYRTSSAEGVGLPHGTGRRVARACPRGAGGSSRVHRDPMTPGKVQGSFPRCQTTPHLGAR